MLETLLSYLVWHLWLSCQWPHSCTARTLPKQAHRLDSGHDADPMWLLARLVARLRSEIVPVPDDL